MYTNAFPPRNIYVERAIFPLEFLNYENSSYSAILISYKLYCCLPAEKYIEILFPTKLHNVYCFIEKVETFKRQYPFHMNNL